MRFSQKALKTYKMYRDNKTTIMFIKRMTYTVKFMSVFAIATLLALLNTLLVLTQEFPRFYRYSMGSRMVDMTLDMLSLIYKANDQEQTLVVSSR